jgi:hypothetical protein
VSNSSGQEGSRSRVSSELLRFTGRIAGLGSTSGVRIVVGSWSSSPWGGFADVMVEQADGHRVLLAPDDRVADLLQLTYLFDELVLGDVQVIIDDDHWTVSAPRLRLTATVGGRVGLGWLLRMLPRAVSTSPRWLTMINPIARLIMKGVQTRGTARGGRTEYYGAYDLRRITSAQGTWRDLDLGQLAPVDPPVRFGFGSSPRQPSVTDLVTTIRLPRTP